ncbi:MAG: nucleotidyltransferase domain-containing protein [Elusimicrobiota bacterium]
MKLVLEIIKKIVKKIQKQYQPEKIILFGSHAWGNPTRDSDVDMLIIKETGESSTERWLKIRNIVYEENLEIPLDLLVYTPEELKNSIEKGNSFIKQIITKGRVLYGRR